MLLVEGPHAAGELQDVLDKYSLERFAQVRGQRYRAVIAPRLRVVDFGDGRQVCVTPLLGRETY